MKEDFLSIAMLCIHSSPVGTLGTKDTGGMSVYVRELARKLGQRDHTVDIFTHVNADKYPRSLDLCHNVRLVHLGNGGLPPRDKGSFLAALPDYFRDFAAFKESDGKGYDLIHSHYWLSGPLGVQAQERWGMPHVITFHTLGAVKNHAVAREIEPAERIRTEQSVVHFSRRIISATEQEREQLHRFYDASLDRIGIVPCGVDFERFFPMEQHIARKQLLLGDGDKVLLYVGRFDELKGIEQLLEAMGLIGNRRRPILLVVGGGGEDDPERNRLETLCRKWKLQRHVRFYGAVDHDALPVYYSAADALIIPSRYESFSLVALEALACGTPVMASRVGAMESLIQEGKNGTIMSKVDPHSLASAVEGFVFPKRSFPFSREAVRQSVERFTWDNAASQLLKEYASVCRS